MKVLHINSTIVENSGVMSVIMNYYRNIDRDKIQFDFLYFSQSLFGYKTYESEIVKMGGRVYYFDNFKRIITFNRNLDVLLKENKYEAVHIHDPFVLRLIYKTLRKKGIKNIIVHSHATKWSDKVLSCIRNKLLCFGFGHLIDYPFACSKAAGEFLYKKRSFFVMNNAINIDNYRFCEKSREIIQEKYKLKNKIVFAHVGNFCKQKNHAFLIDIFQEITYRESNAILIMIGDGILRHEIERKVEKYNLSDKVIFLGKRNDVEKYYSVMDCMILPSLYEGLPMVGVEGQCNGIPFVFSDNVTREVGCSFSRFLSLEDDQPCVWAENALELANVKWDRGNAVKEISSMGFSISKEVLKVQKKYLEMIE